ncbi:oligopeptide/dipeptide ABC transporter, ATPase subunit [Thermocrinis albus DSM 14484]|uniref:Oligopeptide/dipeptide ABC transporter, ATPase subunit n=1 Tax=Thermocrinis albus (strain DSM 14484 / JCM 11386 / HI 11/12) TaxID=638303 RepID=D3SLK3_THEAH|nr:ABC transporter ATP-binding protein [Thermocrinis albus]ADC89633.1 oligopeptide/dipeptide ABC transporter, ATPase subunit [Thermocrinis albus DSM 14484]
MKELDLRLEKVSKRFGSSFWALRDISMVLPKGRITALVGESGSGKSTLGKIILRLERPTSGRVLLGGMDIFAMGKEYTRMVSVVFQDPTTSLNPRMRVREILEEPLVVHKVKDREKVVVEALQKVGLDNSFLDRKPHQLSGGQRQRVAIARAMALKPAFIVADEPTASLDASRKRDILDLFVELRSMGTGVLLITHDITAVKYTADILYVLYRGKLLEYGDKEKLLLEPLHPYTRYLLDHVPARHPSLRSKGEWTETVPFFDAACPFYSMCRYRKEECERSLREVIVDGRFVACNLY